MQSETFIDPSVQNELKPGERLLWWGKPDPAHRVKNNTALYINISIRAILAVFALVLIFIVLNLLNMENGYGDSPQSSTIFLLFFCIMLFILSLFRVFQYYNLMQKNAASLRHTTYAITEQRILVITASSKNYGVKSHTRSDIGQILRTETGAGWGDVSYGVPRTQQSGFRSLTVVDKLAGVPNARMVEDILMRTFKNNQPSPQQAWYSPQSPQPQSAPVQPQSYSPDQPYPSYPPLPQHYMQPQQPYPPQPQPYGQPPLPPVSQE